MLNFEMEWLLETPHLQGAFSSLGSLMGNCYVVSTDALAILEDINYKLTYEDQTLRTFRRAIGFGQNVRADLIPLLENTKDEQILDMVIRVLVNLTVPIECLFSVDVMYRTEMGRHTVFELNKLLHTSKEAFTDPKSTKSVVEYMKHILESESKLSPKKCDQINNCLLLLRNILHIPELNANYLMPSTSHKLTGGIHPPISMQNAIIWNLFIQSIDKMLLYLMTCPHKAFWGVTMVQLIALIYKDQHVSTLQKLLSHWFEASLSESSDDNESNTTPPKQGSCDSSPMLTSDPTSDSSDNGSKNGNSGDRRQALREETEATLQEVSRKGQEYHDSMLRVPADSVDNSSEGASDVGAAEFEDAVELAKDKSMKKSSKIIQKPAEQDSSTTNMPPPALPIKPSNRTQTKTKSTFVVVEKKQLTATPKSCQKSPHAGHFNLTKANCGPQKRECPSSQSELSDCGYATQIENQESISTSSNDDDSPQTKPQHQKPPCSSKTRIKTRILLTTIDQKELRRKKLVKRSKSSLINMKGLVQHTPTDGDISNLLKEFTVDFLLKGFNYIVDELHSQLLSDMDIPIDTSHFFWLVTYFLKFAAQLELDIDRISFILTYDVISYLTYEAVMQCEQLELNLRQQGNDLKACLRRMHLAVTSIREFLQAIETYKKVTHLSEEDRERFQELQLHIAGSEDLRNLFVLLIRRFNPSLHTKQYLQDLVVTNHLLLLLLDGITTSQSVIQIKMIDHLSQFGTLEIMHYYGILLVDFNTNGEFVNNCIFTMMHHIGGDIGQVGALFQPSILTTYSKIWEAGFGLCSDWSDLIEYVINKFWNTPQKNPLILPSTSLTELTKEHNMETTVCTWTQEEMDALYWYYVQSKKSEDIVGKILNLFSRNGNTRKSRISIVQQLLQQDIITIVEYDDLMKFEDAECQHKSLNTPPSSESGIELKVPTKPDKPLDDIQMLRDLMIKEKKQQHLVWLQKLLLECCYIKLIFKETPLRKDHKNLSYIMEPVAYHSLLKKKSVPIVQWNNEQAATMLYQPFVLLLHKLGFQLPADADSVFARIPEDWTPEMMFNLAKKLGPLEKLLIKFDIHQFDTDTDPEVPQTTKCHFDVTPRNSFSSMGSSGIEGDRCDNDGLASIPEVDDSLEKTPQESEIFAIPNAKHCNSIIRYTPEPTSMPSIPNWLRLVVRSKCVNSNSSTNTAPSATADCFANMTTNASNESDNWMPNENSTTTPTSTNNIAATKSNCNDLVEIKTSGGKTTSALVLAAARALLQQTTATATKPLTIPLTTASLTTSSPSLTSLLSIAPIYTTTTTVTETNSVSFKDYQQQKLHNQQQQQQQEQQQHIQEITNLQHSNDENEDSFKRSLKRKDSSDSSGFCTRSGSGNLEHELCAIVALAYEKNNANSDTASVASDLTRMYVSDEEHEYSVAHYH